MQPPDYYNFTIYSPMRIAIYARKSTESEDRQVQSLEDQINALTALAKREGIHISEIYQEARSAKTPNNRTEFERLTKAIQDGSVNGVLTWSINRLSRNSIDGGLVAYLLQTGKLDFIRTIERTYRPDDNALLLSIENGMAIAYLQDLSRNVSRGMKGKVERGWHVCKAPIGYKNDAETREVVPDEDRFHLVRKGWDMMLAGNVTVCEVHRRLVQLGLTARSRNRKTLPVSRSKVHSLFRDRFYMGEISFNGQSYPGKHVAMVTEDEFQAVQAKLGYPHVSRKPERRNLALSNTMVCEVCGCHIVGEVRSKYFKNTNRSVTYTYYHCTGAKGCSKHGIREEALIQQILPNLTGLRLTESTAAWIKDSLVESFEREACGNAVDASSLERDRRKLDARLSELTVLRLDGEITAPEYAQHRATILDRMTEVREQVYKAGRAVNDTLDAIYLRIDMAVRLGELKDRDGDPYLLGEILRLAGKHLLNLDRFEFRIDPILQKITTFEPLRDGSDKPKRGDLIPLNSVWWALLDDLRTSASDQMMISNCVDATLLQEPNVRFDTE